MYKFYETIRDFGGEIMSTISHLRDVTLFAPSNAALEEPGVQKILQNKERVKEILNLHYVKERLPLDKIKNKSVSQVSDLTLRLSPTNSRRLSGNASAKVSNRFESFVNISSFAENEACCAQMSKDKLEEVAELRIFRTCETFRRIFGGWKTFAVDCRLD